MGHWGVAVVTPDGEEVLKTFDTWDEAYEYRYMSYVVVKCVEEHNTNT